MKTCNVAITKTLAGQPLVATSEDFKIAVSLASGIPRIIPQGERQLIREGHLPTLRFYLSLFGMYKGFESKYGPPDFSSITATPMDPDKATTRDTLALFSWFCENIFWPTLKFRSSWEPDTKLEPKIHMSSKSAPVSKQWNTWGLFAWLWMHQHQRGIKAPMAPYLIESGSPLWPQFLASAKEFESRHGLVELIRSVNDPEYRPGTDLGLKPLSKLALKKEPAGKLRVFAIVDPWTQTVLKPLHENLFGALKALKPYDATFDQVGSLSEFVRSNLSEDPFIGNYDLSKATDMIPRELYYHCLKSVFPEGKIAQLMAIMTQRDFQIPGSISLRKDSGATETRKVRYSRGQPMGALGSWALLAVTHHALVQFAAFKARRTNADYDYRVLGDDVTIRDEPTCLAYVSICEDFGIPIGLAKSFVGKSNLVNFANQTY
jgi:hypothetical protein